MQRILQRFSLGNIVTESRYELFLVEKQKGTTAAAHLLTSIIASLRGPRTNVELSNSDLLLLCINPPHYNIQGSTLNV